MIRSPLLTMTIVPYSLVISCYEKFEIYFLVNLGQFFELVSLILETHMAVNQHWSQENTPVFICTHCALPKQVCIA